MVKLLPDHFGNQNEGKGYVRENGLFMSELRFAEKIYTPNFTACQNIP